MCSDIKSLEFILEKIDDAISYRDNYSSINELLNSKMGYDATLMCILQIGETLKKRFSEGFCGKYKSILPIEESYWTRNYIAHDYEGVNKEIIETIVKIHLPKLKTDIEAILLELKESKQ